MTAASRMRAALLRLVDKKRRQELRRAAVTAANDPDDLAESQAVMQAMEALRVW